MLLCISFDHRATPFALLETLSRHEQAIAASYSDADFLRGVAVLATCNRFEIYLDVRSEIEDQHPVTEGAPIAAVGTSSGLNDSASPLDIDDAADLAFALLAEITQVPAATLRISANVQTNGTAAEHLIGVASGLHSVAKGEEEIAGQVRRAHSAAQQAGTASHALERLFQAATRTSRTVKNRTGLRSAGRSLVDLSLRMAESRITEWNEARVLLIGTGAYAGATVAALRNRGARRIEVFSPSGRAAEYGKRHGLTPVAADEFGTALGEADLVIACSRVEEPILTTELLRSSSTERPRLLLDLGMPRNVDQGVTEVPGVSLLDLETISKHSSVTELGAEAEALQLVREAASEFTAVQAERDALPTLLTFRTHVLSIMEDELCRVRRASAAEDGTPSASSEESLRRFTGRLLHEPMTRIRSLAREGRADEATEALEALFGLDADAGQAGA